MMCQKLTSQERLSPPSPDLSQIVKVDKYKQKKLLQAFLLTHLQVLFYKTYQKVIRQQPNDSTREYDAMDSNITQQVIRDIVATGEYSLEGIAYYTRIPFDVIFDGVCGKNNRLSTTSWTRIVGLYLQVKPEMLQRLSDPILKMKEKHDFLLSLLLQD